MSTSKSSCKGKCSPQAEEHKDKHDHDDHPPHSGSWNKDLSHIDKSSKCISDKEGSGTVNKENCKHSHSPDRHASSVKCQQKEPSVSSSICSPGSSQCTKSNSPSRSMSDLDDCRSFTAPYSSSTSYKSRGGPCYCSTSTDSRCSLTPMDSSLYNSFGYLSTPGFGRAEVTPQGA